MRKSFVLLTIIMLSATIMAQKIDKNNGYAYKVRKNGKNIEVLDSMMVGNKTDSYSILNKAVASDTIGFGKRSWIVQNGGTVITRDVNLLPFNVYTDGSVVSNKLTYLRVVLADTSNVVVKNAKISLSRLNTKNKPDTLAKLEYDEKSLCYVLTKKVKMDNRFNYFLNIEAEIDGVKYDTRYILVANVRKPWIYKINMTNYNKSYKERHTDKNISSYSWAVLDKNKYKPEDTIRWKIVAIDGTGKPLSGKVNMNVNYKKTESDITLNERGSAWGEIAIKDIEDIKANRTYYIQWHTADETKTITSTSFRYEDYELKSINATVTAENAEWGNPVKMSIKVTDEKNQPLMNGNVDATMNISSISKIYEDVLITDNETITSSKEIVNGMAEWEIPTDKLPKADMYLQINWTFRTPDGEKKLGSCSVKYMKELPVQAISNPSTYFDESEAYNKADSVGFKARCMGEEFSWTILKDGKVIDKGADTLLIWRTQETKDAVYELWCMSVTGKKSYQKTVHSSYQVNLTVDQKTKVQPGEESEIHVKVTDLNGKPIEGIDLTAMAYTTKLNYYASKPSSWETKQKMPYLDRINSVKSEIETDFKGNDILKLVNGESVEYSKLVNNNGKVICLDKKSSIKKPQIVPVLVRDGKIVPVTRVDINYATMYLAGTDDRYVFYEESKHNSTHTNTYIFYDRDTMYTVEVKVKPKYYTKRWYSIPADICTKTPLDNNERYKKIGYVQNNQILEYQLYQEKGKAFIETKIGLIYPNGSHIRFSGTYRELRLDTICNDIAVFGKSYKTRVSVFGKERIVVYDTQKETGGAPDKKDKTYKYILYECDDLLDDSLLTMEDLRKNYLNEIESQSRYINQLPDDYYQNSDFVVHFLNDNYDKRPKLIGFAQAGENDPEKYFITNNTLSVRVNTGNSYDFVMIFDNNEIRRVTVDVPKDNNTNVYLNTTYDSSKCVVNDFSKALGQRILRLTEDQFTKSGKFEYIYHNYNPTNTEAGTIRIRGVGSKSASNRAYAENQSDTGYDEVVAVAYGSASKKSIVGSNAVMKPGTEVMDEEESEDDLSYFEEMPTPAPNPDAEVETEIRDNFNDVGYWVPDAVTDHNGEAIIKVKYPDDLTQWETLLVGIKGKYRGYYKTRVTATKDVVGQLKMPRFAIEGDSVGAVGIGIDYINNVSVVDTFYHTATGDSLCMTYVYGNDGEKRCVPIYKQGMEAIEGEYKLIEKDTTFQLAFNKDYSTMKIGVYGDVREMMMQSIKEIAENEWCGSNDYLAIKLEALRMQPQTDSVKLAILKIEKRLRENRLSNGMWGWYGKSSMPQMWVTERVVKALNDKGTTEMKYAISQAFENCRQKYTNWSGMLQAAKLFGALGDTAQMEIRLKEIDKDSLSLTELIDWQMLMGLEVNFDTLRHKTYTDGEYYGVKKYDRLANCCWFDPVYQQVELTLRAYRYYDQKGDKERCKRIKLWLMQYTRGRWMSDATKLDIVKTLWGKEGIQMKDVLYQLSIGDQVVDALPYTMVADKAMKVEFKGNRDIYIGTEQTRWEENPKKESNGMSVESHYDNGILKVTFTLENDAEYLVLCCPIPAGCSYEDNQGWYGYSGCEQYRNKIYVYFDRASEGEHTIEIKLNERYPGRYTVNPSQAKLIYFPVFNGNGEMQVVEF